MEPLPIYFEFDESMTSGPKLVLNFLVNWWTGGWIAGRGLQMSEQENGKIVKTCGWIGEKFASWLCGSVGAEWTGEVSGKEVRNGREDEQ